MAGPEWTTIFPRWLQIAGNLLQGALKLTARERGTGRELTGIGRIAIAVEIGRAHLLRTGRHGRQGEHQAGEERGEPGRHRDPLLLHRTACVQTRSAPARRTVCIITTASGKSSRQPQAEISSSPGPSGQTLAASQA